MSSAIMSASCSLNWIRDSRERLPSSRTRPLQTRQAHTPSVRRSVGHSRARFVTSRRTVCSAVTDTDSSIASAREVLVSAAETKASDGDAVVDALLTLEKSMRSKAKEDPEVSKETLAQLNGAWRLVFTTGTIDTQKKFGRRINYFPIKAVQCFNTSNMRLTNGIFVGDFALLKFSGPFSWNEASRKLEFDFTSIAVLGAKFDIGAGKAAEIGASTGLGSNNNKKLVDGGKKPFFNWVSADADIATARGGGGGLALWRRDLDMEARNEADPSLAP